MTDIKQMQLGAVVDFCIDYNRRQERAEKAAKAPKPATQADIDRWLG